MILAETKLLARKPHLGMVDENGTVRQLSCGYASELTARLPIYIGSSGNCGHNSLSHAASAADEMNIVNKHVPGPSFLPQLGENQRGKLPRVTNTFYSTASSIAPDGQVGYPINHSTRASGSSNAVENADENFGQMKRNRSCMPSPGLIATGSLGCIGLVYRALLFKCCFRRTKGVKFRTPRGSSNQEDPIREDEVATISGAVTIP
ncbi:hypothetical protein ACJ73_09403 [Blastomyces percursus]|uniref:Uncharacterized protein n=1 Tax=Blastomyces percursus TaxID=1658174 RepID=A0A1J9P635_9EURO|nr:hypothetical protein ACJ73_09403 [Blastomyces percursus]